MAEFFVSANLKMQEKIHTQQKQRTSKVEM